jgi:hypothetical protein
MHAISIGDRVMWVRPDIPTTGANRGRVISQALDHLAHGVIDPMLYLRGALFDAGATDITVIKDTR